MIREPGTLACTVRLSIRTGAGAPVGTTFHGNGARAPEVRLAGGLIVDVEAERYRIAPEDVRSLIFSSRPAPVTYSRIRRERGIVTGEITVGEACGGCTPPGGRWSTSSVMRGGERHLCHDCLKTAK